jgi:membrane protease YdiL (CAAX protease family)
VVRPWQPGPPEAWRPRPYPQLLRGPTYRWWRLPLAVALGIVFAVGFGFLVVGAELVLRLLGGEQAADVASDPDADAWLVTPLGLLYTNLTLAALIPLTLLVTWAAFGWRPRWVSSITPGVRWRWLLVCLGVSAAVLGVTTVVLELLSGYAWTPERDWPWLVLVVLLTTPLQAAGEEYLFRGWIPQLVGAAIPHAVVGALLGGAISSTLFALAHGEQDVWLFGDRFAFGVLACWLAWRTGGLEAGIALHSANNLVALLLTIGSGDLAESLGASEGSPVYAVFDVATLVVTIALIAWAARRRGLVRLFVPPIGTAPPPEAIRA